jgi:hypothetical protein
VSWLEFVDIIVLVSYALKGMLPTYDKYFHHINPSVPDAKIQLNYKIYHICRKYNSRRGFVPHVVQLYLCLRHTGIRYQSPRYLNVSCMRG